MDIGLYFVHAFISLIKIIVRNYLYPTPITSFPNPTPFHFVHFDYCSVFVGPEVNREIRLQPSPAQT